MERYKVLRIPLHNNVVAEDVLNTAAEEGFHITPAVTVSNQDLVLIVAKEIPPELKEVMEKRVAKRAKSEE